MDIDRGFRSAKKTFRYTLILIALTAFVLRVEPYLQNGPGLDPDSYRYIELAKGLVFGCGFARLLNGSCADPEMLRAPGYPLFLALTHTLGTSIVIVSLLAAGVIFAMGTVISSHWSLRAGLLAAALLAFDLPSIGVTSCVMSDALFQSIVAAALLLQISALGKESANFGFATLSAVLFGLCALVRPIGEFLWPAAWIPILFASDSNHRKRLFYAIFAAVISLAPIVGWSIRNQRVMGSFALSTEGPITLYYFTAGAILAADSHSTLWPSIHILEHQAGVASWADTPARLNGELLRRTARIMAAHPIATLEFELFSFVRMALAPDEAYLRGWLHSGKTPFAGEPLFMHLRARIANILEHPMLASLLFFQVAWLVFVWIGVGRAGALLFRAREREGCSGARFSIALLLYVAGTLYLISGATPASAGRIRMAFVPALVMLAAIGWTRNEVAD